MEVDPAAVNADDVSLEEIDRDSALLPLPPTVVWPVPLPLSAPAGSSGDGLTGDRLRSPVMPIPQYTDALPSDGLRSVMSSGFVVGVSDPPFIDALVGVNP